MKAPLIHVANLIFNEPLAIRAEKLAAILSGIGLRLNMSEASLEEMRQSVHHPQENGFAGTLNINGADANIITTGGIVTTTGVVNIASAPQVIRLQNGDDDGNGSKPYKLTPEGIAVIPVCGTLMKRNTWMTSASGLANYAKLAQSSLAAMNDSLVKAVLFDIDSPGGTTHGCFELSDMIYGMRGDKPIWACANDLAASAAYALGSAADRLYLTRTGGVGSIGVFALHADQSGFDEQAGVKFTFIYAGDKKTDGNSHEPLSKTARADIQAEVDREYGIFVSTVARNRGFAGANQKKIQALGAEVLYAENATPLLADEVGTLEEALEALTQKVNGSTAKASGKVALNAEAGNNALDKGTEEAPATDNPPATGEPTEGENAMAKQLDLAADEELKRARALVAAADTAAAADKKDPPDPDPDDDGDEPDDDKPKDDAKKGKKAARVTEIPLAANGAAVRIATLCQIAGTPELASEYMIKGYTVDQVIEKLSARRAKASAEGTVNSYVAGDQGGAGAGGRMSVDAAIEQARVMSANSGGKLTQSKCMEQLMRRNPDIYSGYMEEKDRVASQVMFSGGGRALTEYVMNNQRRYMANLGLGTAIEDVPARRPM